MDYYVYECEILTELNKQLNIESICIDSETYDATKTFRNDFGKLENKTVLRYIKSELILLKFYHSFCYSFNRKALRNAFVMGWLKEYVVHRLKCDIQDKFVKEMLIRKPSTV